MSESGNGNGKKNGNGANGGDLYDRYFREVKDSVLFQEELTERAKKYEKLRISLLAYEIIEKMAKNGLKMRIFISKKPFEEMKEEEKKILLGKLFKRLEKDKGFILFKKLFKDLINGDEDIIFAGKIIKEKITLARRKKIKISKEIFLLDDEGNPSTLQEIKKRKSLLKDEIVRGSQQIIISCAKKFASADIPIVDRINEGNIGLFRAIEKFKESEKCGFPTYAHWWIKQAIARAVGEETGMPAHAVDLKSRIYKVTLKLQATLERNPTAKEIADKLYLDEKKIEKFLEMDRSYHFLRLDDPIGEGDEEDLTLGDFIEDERINSPEEEVRKSEVNEKIRKLMKELSPREEKILKMRFGIDVRSDHTLEEVGIDFNLTRERIRQIEEEAFRKLRKKWGNKKFLQDITRPLSA